MRAVVLLALLPFVAPAQWITASASRSIGIDADQALVTITATTSFEATEQDVIRVLMAAGLDAPALVAANLSIPQFSIDQSGVDYQFSITFPFEQWRDVAAKLDQLRRQPQQPLRGLQWSLSAVASVESIQAARARELPALVAEARRKAESVADRLGVQLSGLEEVSEIGPVFAGAAPYLVAVRLVPAPISPMSNTFQTLRVSVRFGIRE